MPGPLQFIRSQGLTFERAIIDAEAAFAHGQVYVALSRCKTLEGMVLRTPINKNGVDTDEAVLAFDARNLNKTPSEDLLLRAKVTYQQQLLLECFDFGLLRKRLGFLLYLLRQSASILQLSKAENIETLEQLAKETIFDVSENFKNQLRSVFAQSDSVPESDAHILERASKASGWFSTKFAEAFAGSVQTMEFETDNKELRKKLTNVLNNTKKEISVKLAGIESCAEAFIPGKYLHALATAEIDFQPLKTKKKAPPKYTEADIAHPDLFESLRSWRSAKASELDIAHFQILYQRVLINIVVELPDTLVTLKKIPGVGKMTIEKYGDEIVAVVRDYRKKHKYNLPSYHLIF